MSKTPSVKMNSKSVSKKTDAALSKKKNWLRQKGPGILRGAISSVLASDSRTKKYSAYPKTWKVDHRLHGKKKRTGLEVVYTAGTIEFNIRITKGALGEEAWWPLSVLQFGRKGLPARHSGEGPYAMAIRKEDVLPGQKYKKYTGSTHRKKRGYVAVFTYGPIRAVQKGMFDWMGESATKARDKIVRKLNRLRHG